MEFEQALKDFTYNRIEEIMLSPDNVELKKIYNALDHSLEKLGLHKKDYEEIRVLLFELIDSQNQLIYKQGLADAISFLSSLPNTKNRLGL